VKLAWINAAVFAFDMDCAVATVVMMGSRESFGVCEVTNLTITERGEKITSVLSMQYDVIRRLFILNTTVNFVPKFYEEFAGNLTTLVIDFCHLRDVEREDLAQLPILERVSLCHNDLQTLPGDLFMNNPKLTSVYMSGNQFKTIGANILSPLTVASIQLLDFSDAGCVNFHAKTSKEPRKWQYVVPLGIPVREKGSTTAKPLLPIDDSYMEELKVQFAEKCASQVF
jgi:Leucine-rich repeat (LRR) protein